MANHRTSSLVATSVAAAALLIACKDQPIYTPPKPGEAAALVTIRIFHRGPAPRPITPRGAVRILGRPVPRASVEIDHTGLPLPFVPFQPPAVRRTALPPSTPAARTTRPQSLLPAPARRPGLAGAPSRTPSVLPSSAVPTARRAPFAATAAAAGTPSAVAPAAAPSPTPPAATGTAAPSRLPAPSPGPRRSPGPPRSPGPAPAVARASTAAPSQRGIVAWTRVRPGWRHMAVVSWHEQRYQAWEQQPFQMTTLKPCLRKVCQTVNGPNGPTKNCTNRWTQCPQSVKSTRTVLATKVAAFGACRAEGTFAFDPGRYYVLTYVADGQGRCLLTCHEQVPVGRGRFVFRPCPNATAPVPANQGVFAPPRTQPLPASR